MEPELTLTDPEHDKGCARCGLVAEYDQPVTLIVQEDGYYEGLALCPNCAR
jgi:hypothetical protein